MRSLLIRKGDREILLEFGNIDDTDTVIKILDKTRTSTSIADLVSEFPIEKKQDIEKIVFRFRELKILIDNKKSDISGLVLDRDFERALDNYFWENEIAWPEFLRYKETLAVRIIGLNNIGLLVVDLLEKIGISDVKLIDYPYLTNKQLEKHRSSKILSTIPFDQFISTNNKNESLIIVADEFGNTPSLLQLNHILCSEKLPFLPLFIQSQIGYIGPFVVPGKTSCFHCMLSRLEATRGKLNLLNASEMECFDWQDQSNTHPSVVAALAHFFTFQLTLNMGYAIKGSPTDISNAGLQKKTTDLIQKYCNMVTEIDLITPKIFDRRILRKPNCPCCRELITRQKIVFNFAKEYVS